MCRRAEKRSYGEQYESYDKYPLEAPEITQAAEGWYEAAEYQKVSHSNPGDQADTGIKVPGDSGKGDVYNSSIQRTHEGGQGYGKND